MWGLWRLSPGLRIEHPFRYDVTAWLQSPSGAWTPLVWDAVPDTENYDVTLSDHASLVAELDAESHVLGDVSYEYVLRSAGALGQFRGESAQGDWELILCDYFPSEDDGLYLGAQLRLTSSELQSNTRADWSGVVDFVDDHDFVGPEELTIYGLDSVGNRSAEPVAVSFFRDNVAPEVCVEPVSDTLFYVTTQDGGKISAAFADIRMARGQWLAVGMTQQQDGWALDTDPLGAGPYQAYFVALDGAGNETRQGPYVINLPAKQEGLEISKSDWVDPLPVGWNQRYTLVITNLLDIPLTNVVISDTLPAQTYPLLDLTSPGAVYDEDAGEVVWTIDELDAEAVVRLELGLKTFTSIRPGTILSNTVQVSSLEARTAAATQGTTMSSSQPVPTPLALERLYLPLVTKNSSGSLESVDDAQNALRGSRPRRSDSDRIPD